MGKLIYLITTSLDGYATDNDGRIDWAQPGLDERTFINGVLRNVGTFLLGRRLSEAMAIWDTLSLGDADQATRDFAKIWRTSAKTVYSRTQNVSPVANATVEHSFEPDKVRQMKADYDQDLDIGGPHLAAAAMRAGLVDEVHRIVTPDLLGGGTSWLPDDTRLSLELVGTRRFDNGFVALHYRPRRVR